MTESEVFCGLICRACLGSGRLYNIHEYHLADPYSQITGTKVLSQDGLPQHLCTVCSTLVLKLKEFRNQCLEAEVILDNIKKRHDMITSNLISDDLKLCKRYSQTITNTTEYPQDDPTIIIDSRETRTYLSEVKPIKSEVETLYLDNFSMKTDESSTDTYSSQLYIDETQTNEETDLNDAKLIETNKLTQNETDILVNEKTETKPKLKKAKNNNLDNETKISKKIDTGKDKDCQSKFKRAAKTNKIKGKYFETKENMTNFACVYEVDIIVLSKEQQMNDVLDRKTSQNYINMPSKCQYCYKGFIDEEHLDKHFKSQHDPIRGGVTCEFCQYRYKDKRGLNQHLKSHRLKFVCRQCKYVSRTTYNAKEHYMMHRGHRHVCKDCGKSFDKLPSYLTHMRAQHPAGLVWCDLCGEPFVGEFGLNGHKKRVHRDVQLPAWCACACGSRFTGARALRRHACGRAACAHCGDSFSTAAMLREHLRGQHSGLHRQYSCSKCSKKFGSESLYSAHYRRMHGEASKTDVARHWICEICGKTLPNKCRLVYHQRVHTGEKPYHCPQCPKTFTLSKLLRSHSRVHSSERPYVCKFCPKTFKGPSALRVHGYMHTGGKMKDSRSDGIKVN